MPVASGVKVSTVPGDLPGRTVRKHFFMGANVQMSGILGNDLFAERARGQLISGARVNVENVESGGGRLNVRVRVTSLTGHKFPTGFPSRRAWIRLTVNDSSGNTLFESGGATSPARG